MDIEKTVGKFRTAMLKKGRPLSSDSSKKNDSLLKVTPGPLFERFAATVDMTKALEMFYIEW